MNSQQEWDRAFAGIAAFVSTLTDEHAAALAEQLETRQKAKTAIERGLRINAITDPGTNRADNIAESLMQHIAFAGLTITKR